MACVAPGRCLCVLKWQNNSNVVDFKMGKFAFGCFYYTVIAHFFSADESGSAIRQKIWKNAKGFTSRSARERLRCLRGNLNTIENFNYNFFWFHAFQTKRGNEEDSWREHAQKASLQIYDSLAFRSVRKTTRWQNIFTLFAERRCRAMYKWVPCKRVVCSHLGHDTYFESHKT